MEPTLPVSAVARRLGVAPATLRTWARRYGIGPSGHTVGRHRRYAPEDIARLEVMQRALLRGATPAEAARYALSIPLPTDTDGEAGAPGVVPVSGRTPQAPAPRRLAVAATVPQLPGTRADGVSWSVRAGGRVLRLAGGSPQARGLARAALAMDCLATQQLLADTIAEQGVIAVWEQVARPVLGALAGQWEHTGDGVEIEHLVHECVLAAMIAATPLVADPRNPRPVLLSCAPEERHSLPLYVLRAELAQRRIGTQMLGAALPAGALVAAVRRTGPSAVALWAQLPRHASPAVFDGLPSSRPRARLFACGPGWHGVQLPNRVRWLDDLTGAVTQVERLLDANGS